ncbi:MAG: CsbD family protein [Acidobacteriaceae bacterium]|jgi:uncharacterized protein YjbJ (UPF0337 family)
MNKETVQGGAEKLSGQLKEAAGNATDNDRLKTEGQAEQVKGGVRQAVGKAKDAASDAADYVANR